MSTKEARYRAHDKYQAEKIDVIYVRVPKGKKAIIQEHAEAKGESVNKMINRLIDKELDSGK